ncbi:hypothetical protein LXL04_018303 [Taraxacum kok-saghyz]
MEEGSVQGYFSPVNQDLGGFEPPTSQEMIPSALTISELTDLYQHQIMNRRPTEREEWWPEERSDRERRVVAGGTQLQRERTILTKRSGRSWWSGAGRLRVGVEVEPVAFASEWKWSPSRRIAGVATPEIVAGRFKPQRERG